MAQNKFNSFFFKLSQCALIFILFCSTASSTTKNSLPTALQQQLLMGQHQQALPQLLKLANHGNHSAQYQLALFYLQGTTLKKSPKQAEFWLLQAAEANDKASGLLGELYAKGRVFNKDLMKAKKFLTISKDMNNKRAKKLYNNLFSSVSHSQTSKQLQNALFTAINQYNLSKVIELYKQGADIIYTDKQGNTPLIVSLQLSNKQEEIALWIIKTIRLQSKIKHLNHVNKNGNSALHIAAKNNHAQATRLLLDSKADIDTLNNNKQPPLFLAIKSKNQRIAQQLINQGALVNIKDSNGNTPLSYAKSINLNLILKSPTISKKPKKLSSKELVRKRQSLTVQATDKQSPYYDWPILSIAVAQKQSEIVKLLLNEKHDPWKKNIQNDSALSIAIKQGQSEVALQLFDTSNKSASTLSNEDKIQLSMLFQVAIQHNNLTMLNKLLTLTNPTESANTPIEKTALWYAIKHKHVDAFLAIAKQIPPTNRQNNKYNSYLLFAAQLNLLDISKFLISSELDVNLRDDKGRSALWYASNFANSELVSLLIFAKSQVNLIDHNGYSPLMRAVISDCVSCINILLNAGANAQKQTANANSPLMFAAQDKPEILALILNFDYKGKDGEELNIKQRNNQNLTPLMLAVTNQCERCVELLLKAGANPKRKNAQGQNSFELAKGNNKIKILLNQY